MADRGFGKPIQASLNVTGTVDPLAYLEHLSNEELALLAGAP